MDSADLCDSLSTFAVFGTDKYEWVKTCIYRHKFVFPCPQVRSAFVSSSRREETSARTHPGPITLDLKEENGKKKVNTW